MQPRHWAGGATSAVGPDRSHPFLLTVFAFLAIACLLVAQAARAQDFSFSQVVIEGNQRVDTASIVRLVGIGRGEAVSSGALNDAYQRVASSGLFETVDFDPQGDTLLIRVREFPTISVISFEGNRRLNDEDLSALVESKPNRVYSPALAESDAAALAQAYNQAGRISATVTPKIIRQSDNRVDLVFEIQEGRVVEVERLAFVGNRAYSDRRLRQVLETKQAGLLRTFIRSDTFIADRVEFDKQLLRDFYASRGFVDFEVLDVTSELARERDGFFLTFTIFEGQSFRVGNVSFVSEIEELDIEEFAAAARLRSGVTYSPAVIDNNIARMENLALRQGLNFVRVEPRITRNDRDLTLDVEFALVRGPRIFVERIDIEGNTTTLDEVIRRQFRTVEGDPFNPREIRRSAERIRALGFFSDAQVNTEPGTASDQVLVNVDVVEQPTGTLSLGASYSISEGVGLSVGFSESNFLGRGQGVAASISVLDDSTSISGSFIEPAFLGRDVSLKLSGFYFSSQQSDANYNTQAAGFEPALVFPTGELSRLEVRYDLNQYEIFDVDKGSSRILKQEEARGAVVGSGIGYTFSYDTRKSGLNPLGGALLQFGQDFYGIGGDQTYIETSALASFERRVFNEEINLRATIEGGVQNYSGDGSIISQRFWTNNKIRGFERNEMGPRDLTAPNQDALAGNMYVAARFEADFPLGFPEEYGLRGGVFLDTGSLWGLNDTAGTGGPVDDSFHLRAVAGLSLFWTSPLGPLRFNFTNAFLREDYDIPQNFDFTIATEF